MHGEIPQDNAARAGELENLPTTDAGASEAAQVKAGFLGKLIIKASKSVGTASTSPATSG